MRIFDRANDYVGDTKVDTNKTPFEYTYISQHFGFIIPSSLALRTRQEEEEEGKKMEKKPIHLLSSNFANSNRQREQLRTN